MLSAPIFLLENCPESVVGNCTGGDCQQCPGKYGIKMENADCLNSRNNSGLKGKIDLVHADVNRMITQDISSQLHERYDKQDLKHCHDPLHRLNNKQVLTKKHCQEQTNQCRCPENGKQSCYKAYCDGKSQLFGRQAFFGEKPEWNQDFGFNGISYFQK